MQDAISNLKTEASCTAIRFPGYIRVKDIAADPVTEISQVQNLLHTRSSRVRIDARLDMTFFCEYWQLCVRKHVFESYFESTPSAVIAHSMCDVHFASFAHFYVKGKTLMWKSQEPVYVYRESEQGALANTRNSQ